VFGGASKRRRKGFTGKKKEHRMLNISWEIISIVSCNKISDFFHRCYDILL
jgi:hypothetical protein